MRIPYVVYSHLLRKAVMTACTQWSSLVMRVGSLYANPVGLPPSLEPQPDRMSHRGRPTGQKAKLW